MILLVLKNLLVPYAYNNEHVVDYCSDHYSVYNQWTFLNVCTGLLKCLDGFIESELVILKDAVEVEAGVKVIPGVLSVKSIEIGRIMNSVIAMQ